MLLNMPSLIAATAREIKERLIYKEKQREKGNHS